MSGAELLIHGVAIFTTGSVESIQTTFRRVSGAKFSALGIGPQFILSNFILQGLPGDFQAVRRMTDITVPFLQSAADDFLFQLF